MKEAERKKPEARTGEDETWGIKEEIARIKNQENRRKPITGENKEERGDRHVNKINNVE